MKTGLNEWNCCYLKKKCITTYLQFDYLCRKLSVFCVQPLFQRKTEAATGDILQGKVFLEISKNSQENTCARVSF